MELSEKQYYKFNRILLSTIGLWPYDNSRYRQISSTLMILIFPSYILIELLKFIVWECSIEFYLKMISWDILIMQWGLKYVTFYAAIENIKKIQDYIRNNWSILTKDVEIDIMCKQALNGKIYTIVIAASVSLGVFTYISLDYLSDVSVFAMVRNESRQHLLPNTTKYLVQQQIYFYILTLQMLLGSLAALIAGVSTETFSLSSALHAFAIFKIARFSNLLVATFGQPYLVLFLMSECSTSIYLFLILTVRLGSLEIITSIFCIFFHLLFLTIGNFVGQEFINCDAHIYQVLCNIRWYNAPVKTQKLIFIMMQKSTKSYKVDAGGLYNPSLQGLVSAMRLLYSFVMMLNSVQ